MGSLRNIFTKMADWFAGPKDEERSWGVVFKDFGIDIEVVDEDNMKFYYNNRLVGRIFPVLDDLKRPRYKLYLYYYHSDLKNLGGKSMNKLDPDDEIDQELRAQREKPYWKRGMVDPDADYLIATFIFKWRTTTTTGRKKQKEIEQLILGPKDRIPSDFAKKVLSDNATRKGVR
jgi:hypothetical protein